MSDTPRCDAAENKEAWRDPNLWVTELQVSWNLARQLERELAGLKEIAETAGRLVRAANVTPMTSTNGCGLGAIGKELATLEKLLREPK